MTLCTVDTSDQFPLALIKSVLSYEPLIFSLTVKYLYDYILIRSCEIQKIIPESLIGYSLFTLNKRKINYIILIIIPVEDTVIKILNLSRSLIFICSGFLNFYSLYGLLITASASGFLGCKACGHIAHTLCDIAIIQLPLHKRVNTGIFISPEKLLDWLLVIESGIRNDTLHKKQHEHGFTTTVGKIVKSIAAIHFHDKVIIALCTEIVLNVIYSYPVYIRHYL